MGSGCAEAFVAEKSSEIGQNENERTFHNSFWRGRGGGVIMWFLGMERFLVSANFIMLTILYTGYLNICKVIIKM